MRSCKIMVRVVMMMPNWCNNKLIVCGRTGRLVEFDTKFKGKGTKWGPEFFGVSDASKKAEVTQKYEKEYALRLPDYSFDALYPVPAEVIALGYSAMSPTGLALEELLVRSAEALNNPEKYYDGFTWCATHWGTKWDLSDVETTGVINEQIEYVFETAWSPPDSWLEKVAKDWPDLKFTLNYDEPGIGFAGILVFEHGEEQSHEQAEHDDYRDFVIEHFGFDPYEGE